MKTYAINNRWALGDSVCLSALPRDLQRAHPGRYRIIITGHYQSFWQNNPYVTAKPKLDQAEVRSGAVEYVKLEYGPGIARAGAGERVHFLSWFHRDFERLTGIKVPVTEPKGDIHLSEAEKRRRVDTPYWVVVAGGKKDMTAKIWSPDRFQQVVDALLACGIRCVQAGAAHSKHYHYELKNVINAVGATDSIRDLFGLIYHAEGVICGVTSFMHLAAVWDKPCVVVAGGREEPWWEGYVNEFKAFGPQCAPVKVPHRFLHTVGLLDCGIGNLRKGCWRARTVPLERADYIDPKAIKRLCKKPVREDDGAMPECMAMVTVDHVVEAVLSYYSDGTLIRS